MMIMRAIPFISIFFVMNACSFVPQLAQTTDDIFTDNALKIEVQKGAMERNADIKLMLDIQNKEMPR